ncbi:MAG: MFS transporter, partial [Bacilli bacterium]
LTGAGVRALHFAAKLWIMSSTPDQLRGRYNSMYGRAYGAGFGIGPLGVSLLPLGLFVPFICAAILFSVSMVITSRVKNDWPVRHDHGQSTGKRYGVTLRLALLALIPASLYGFMEAMLTSNFTIFGQRSGLTPEWVGMCLSVFVVASLILQIPLGVWGDRYGRKRVLMVVMSIGGVLFMLMPLVALSPYALLGLFAITGALVGSIASLGMGYGVDILPKHLLPTLSVMSSLGFGFASIAGPNIGGFSIQYISPSSMFYVLGGVLLAYVILAFFYKPNTAELKHSTVTEASSTI